jgi:hypothetical protein
MKKYLILGGCVFILSGCGIQWTVPLVAASLGVVAATENLDVALINAYLKLHDMKAVPNDYSK